MNPANDNTEARLQLNLPRGQYDNLQALGETNFSTLKHMGRSAAHFKWALEHPHESTETQLRGIAGHVATLEPTIYGGRVYDALDVADGTLYSVWPEANGRRGTNAWDAAAVICRTRGQQLIREQEHKWCVDIATAVHNKPAALPLLKGQREVTMRWSEHAEAMGSTPAFTWKLRGRVDLDTELGLVDLKTTRDSSIEGFMKQVAIYGYHAQAAFYSDGHARITGRRKPYFWIAVEEHPPYAVTVFEVSDQLLARGREIYWEHLQLLRRCTERNEWPQYAEGVVRGAELPRWAMPFEEEPLSELAGGTPLIGF